MKRMFCPMNLIASLTWEWTWPKLIPYLVIGALVLLFAITMFSLASFEKQFVRQFVPIEAGTNLAPSRYFDAMNEAGQALGFFHCGNYVQHRKGLYKAYLALWLTPERTALALICGGKIGGKDYKKTFQISRLNEDRLLVTRDDFSAPDLSGLYDLEIVLNADLPELYARHQARLAQYLEDGVAFSRGSALAAYEEMEAARARELVHAGLAKFLDMQENSFRYTLKGALLMTIRSIQQAGDSEKYLERSKKKRPGS